MLAVVRVGLVPVQAAFGTFTLDLGGLEDGTRKFQEERHADDQGEDGQEHAARHCHRDVTETFNRQRGDLKQCIAYRIGIPVEGEHEDDRGCDEN